ncbi:MAG: HAMP domain-containing histidine kinase, partial [Desulfobacterales bacterium]|nr:HAMP domain-containing histidine kinase [Desulfobacterales bacterium]
KPQSLPVHFAQEYGHDEVGVLARALDESNQRIRDFIEREKQFTRDASHELRTPVTVMKGAMELIHQLPEERRKPLERPLGRIERATTEMEHLIENLLQRAKAKKEGCRSSFDATDLVRRIVQESRYLVEGKEVTLAFESKGEPVLRVPETEFKMAVSNLIRNACHYTFSGSITVRLTQNRFEVEDTGPGISHDILHQITEPFVKGERSKGHGIGLAIVKRICEESGWRLLIESANPGTLARILFPHSQKEKPGTNKKRAKKKAFALFKVVPISHPSL